MSARKLTNMAKQYTLSAAAAIGHVPEHPDRTAYRNASGFLNFDLVFRVWPNRASMLTTIRMQERRAPESTDWKDWYTSRYNRAETPHA